MWKYLEKNIAQPSLEVKCSTQQNLCQRLCNQETQAYVQGNAEVIGLR